MVGVLSVKNKAIRIVIFINHIFIEKDNSKMESNICRSCRRSLDENNENDIFQKDILIKSVDFQSIVDKKWYMKASSAVELITGQKVLEKAKLPHKLCQVCFQNVQAFINFRFQLIRSQEILLESGYPDSKEMTNNKCNETQDVPLPDSSIPIQDLNKEIQKEKNPAVPSKSESSNPLLVLKENHERTSKLVPQDLINVDDSSVSLDINSLHDYERETNVLSSGKLENDQENNNLNDSDNSTNNPVCRNQDVAIKQVDHDIESEIDVCSGEDDEVLELDVQKARNETVEINSSSESDIEVCDYEPVGKKANYNTLSPPIRY